MFLYFDRIVKGEYSDEERTERVLVNGDLIGLVRGAPHKEGRSLIFIPGAPMIEVDGDLELIRQFLDQKAIESEKITKNALTEDTPISDSNRHISGDNNRRSSGRPNGKNGS